MMRNKPIANYRILDRNSADVWCEGDDLSEPGEVVTLEELRLALQFDLTRSLASIAKSLASGQLEPDVYAMGESEPVYVDPRKKLLSETLDVPGTFFRADPTEYIYTNQEDTHSPLEYDATFAQNVAAYLAPLRAEIGVRRARGDSDIEVHVPMGFFKNFDQSTEITDGILFGVPVRERQDAQEVGVYSVGVHSFTTRDTSWDF